MTYVDAIEPEQMIAKAQMVAGQLKLLSNPSRLQIVCKLMDGELSVGELEAELGISQPSLSREIGRLRNAGVLTPRREAKSVFYSLTNPAMVSLIEALCVACKAMENANDKTGNKIAP